MSTSLKEQPVHTYLDDIRFQVVKGNNKRTPFVSSDYQIVAQNAQVIKSIEKNEKSVSADFQRQQNALVKKLEKLNFTRENTAHFDTQNFSGNLNRRRHSTSCMDKSFHLALPTSPVLMSPRAHTKAFPLLDRKNSNSSEGGDSQTSRESPIDRNSPKQVLSRQNSNGSCQNKISLVEARRRSHDIQAATSKMAMEKLERIVAGNKRRATIAAGATVKSLLPPSCELLARLSRADSELCLDKKCDSDSST